ncbi:MAG: hypothetical protein WD077_12835 [Bacteroidia bacterium]
MKKFVLNILLFSGLIALLSLGSYELNKRLISNDPYLIPSNVHTLILGDSRMQTALNPELLPNSVNISMSGEPYIATYLKLKKVIEDNPNIQQIVLGFSQHNISGYSDSKFKDDKISRKLFNRYNLLMKRSDLEGLEYHHTAWYMLYLNQVILPNPAFVRNWIEKVKGKEPHGYPYIGKFYSSDYSLIGRRAKNDSTISRHFYKNGQIAGISQISRSSLDSMVALTQRQNIDLYLFKSPVHPYYENMIPELYNEVLGEIINQLAEYEHVRIFDYSKWRFPDSHYGDYDHINSKGAEILSVEFNKIINSPKEGRLHYITYPPTLQVHP